jgi:hypothetical protein
MGKWISEATEGAAQQFGRRHEAGLFRWHVTKQIVGWSLVAAFVTIIVQIGWHPIHPGPFIRFTDTVMRYSLYVLIAGVVIGTWIMVRRFRRPFKMPRGPRGLR